MDDKPSQALRYGRYKSSMWRAIDATKTGEGGRHRLGRQHRRADGDVEILPESMAQVDRPAIACLWPTARGESIVLDVGATIGADARHLVDLAVMGAAMARVVFDLDRPTVGLLNVGVEEIKGVEAVKEAAGILRESDLPHMAYHGFVEGDDLGKGTVDVVVTEGFTGNIALQDRGGHRPPDQSYLRAAMNRSLMARIGYLFARGAFAALREKLDPRKSNGGVFPGPGGHRHQEPWRHRRGRLRQRRRTRLRDGPRGPDGEGPRDGRRQHAPRLAAAQPADAQ